MRKEEERKKKRFQESKDGTVSEMRSDPDHIQRERLVA